MLEIREKILKIFRDHKRERQSKIKKKWVCVKNSDQNSSEILKRNTMY